MINWLIRNKDLFEAVSYLIIIIGAPIGIYTYIKSNKQEKKDRQFGTYDALDDKFIEFQMMCLDKPYLNIFDVENEEKAELNSLQKKEELIAFSVLFAIFERAFIMYRERSYKDKGEQWQGWLEVIEEYAKRENFREAWAKNGFGWDKSFEHLINYIIKESIETELNEKE